MTITGYLAKCPTKGCRHATHSDTNGCGTCPEHGRYILSPVWGVEVPEIKCGAKCRSATGPACDCSCGGHNHGVGHA